MARRLLVVRAHAADVVASRRREHARRMSGGDDVRCVDAFQRVAPARVEAL